ncbi:hypothetical protein SEA_LUMOS_110 [Mycobacterium phage Lumos]|uniref:Uncharacterized protein n=1 Tax=Mycobacterium phage Lumos TaxID=1701852 RepID=A0A0K2CM13_9CAUD|nr:hypothetical protein AVU96_gp076 [Mycobacterium phage Snenia]YP_010012562.1 hypothetical protein J4T93_gp074 [Mycobacterium phage Lumos]ASM62841.1 hypothetical protein SEA_CLAUTASTROPHE_109 [Mycobacterium phage Clautastrophe]QDF16688.1 hypothetical protein PBI_MSGREEN_111 [Mycobacterium phage MsGreen]QPL14988.1 hypothetical protein SEA_JUBIE_110 [Mycobacterium phage Jubie]ALA06620.1 hypothetical protein SEA_LUMOS_110 [Mycobacterium phage Lumos]ALF01559.1 hypothetical protein SNENIA_109 [My
MPTIAVYAMDTEGQQQQGSVTVDEDTDIQAAAIALRDELIARGYFCSPQYIVKESTESPLTVGEASFTMMTEAFRVLEIPVELL